jgi:hypothetical protein
VFTHLAIEPSKLKMMVTRAATRVDIFEKRLAGHLNIDAA